jgi:hypothetical protein
MNSSQKKYKCPISTQKKFNILIHKGNANQNCIEIAFHPNQNGYYQENEKQEMLAGCGEKKPSYTVSGNIN